MIYTSNYDNISQENFKGKILSISGDRGKRKRYSGECYSKLAPRRDFWDKWFANIGNIPEEENTKYYIREYYDQVLANLNVDQEHRELNEKILICYEDENTFCHRQIVAAWFELFLGERVPEIKENGDIVVDVTNRQFVKDYLESYIKSKIDMRGFESINAVHIYNKGEKIEKYAYNNHDLDIAQYLKDMAFDIEDSYIENMEKAKEKTVS